MRNPTPSSPELMNTCHFTLVEPLECRRLLSVEPVSLQPELVLPGDLQTGPATNQQLDPYIAPGPDGTSLAVWADYRTGGSPIQYLGSQHGTMADIWAARIAADGSLIDQVPIAVNHDQWNQRAPKAAWNGSEWLIAWTTEKEQYRSYIEATRLSPQGEILDSEPILIMDDRYLNQNGSPVNPEGPHDVEPAGSGFVVTWSRMEPPVSGSLMSAHFATLIDANGAVSNPDGTLLRRGTSQNFAWLGLSYSPANGGQLLQAFTIERYEWTPGPLAIDRVHLVRRNLDLTLIDTTYTTMDVGNLNPYRHDIVGSSSGWLLAYQETGIKAVRISSAGTFLDSTPLVISSSNAAISTAFDGDGYVVTYNGSVVHGRRLTTDGVLADPVVVVPEIAEAVQATGHGDGAYSVLFAKSGLSAGDLAITRVAADDSTTGVTDASTAARAHSTPKVASDGTNSLVAFLSIHSNNVLLKGIRLNSTGQPIDAEPFTIATDGSVPEIVFFRGRYIVAYRVGLTVYAQQIGTDGQLIGNRVPLVSDDGALSALSVLDDRLLVTTQKTTGGSTPQYSYIYGRIFDESLSAVSDRLDLGTGFAVTSDVAPVGGRWLVTWSRRTFNTPYRYAVAFRYLDPNGTIGEATDLVSTYPDNRPPSVASSGENASEGMIVWQRFDAPPGTGYTTFFPNSGEGIVGQRIAADGTRIGGLITLVDEPGASAANEAVFDGSNYIITWIDTRDHQWPAQEQGNVYAMRVAIDGTVLDPGGFPIANTDRPEYSATAVSGAGRTYFVYRSFRYEAPWTSYRITTRLLDDPFAPVPTGASFDINSRQSMEFSFNERLPGLATASVVLTNITTGQVIDPAHYTLTEAPGTANEWDYVIRPTPGNLLPDGNYQAVITDAVDKAGNPLEEPVVLDFFVLAGDATRDRYVNLADLAILRANFGQSGKTFSEGDFNYDNVVNLADLAILRGNFGMYLPPPPGPSFFGGGGDDDDDGGGGVLI